MIPNMEEVDPRKDVLNEQAHVPGDHWRTLGPHRRVGDGTRGVAGRGKRDSWMRSRIERMTQRSGEEYVDPISGLMG
jgi:hypothetical protein